MPLNFVTRVAAIHVLALSMLFPFPAAAQDSGWHTVRPDERIVPAPSSSCFRPKEETYVTDRRLYKKRGYRPDTRREIDEYSADSPCAAKLTQIACTIVPRHDFDFDPSTAEYRFKANVKTMAQRNKICGNERFADQLAPGTCSCFLTADNEVMTAGHCFGSKDASYNERLESCQSSYVVFGFDVRAARSGYRFQSNQVFGCKGISSNDDVGHFDVTSVLLTGVAANSNRKPIDVAQMQTQPKPIKGRYLCLMGSLMGGPLKVALGQVRKVHNFSMRGRPMTMIRSDMDGMAGASGSLVVDCETGMATGVYLSGARDLGDTKGEGCLRPIFYDAELAESGVAGENVLFIGSIPEPVVRGFSQQRQIAVVNDETKPAETHAEPVESYCNQLWEQRNSIFNQAGYCFQTPRALARFSNENCKYRNITDVPLSEIDRRAIQAIKSKESVNSCN